MPKREQVGTVRFTVSDEDGKRVVRVPVFEDDDPAEVEAAARKRLARKKK